MRGRPEAFDCLILSVPGHGTIISSAPLGPTLNGDIWKFEQAGEYTFKVPNLAIIPPVVSSPIPIAPG